MRGLIPCGPAALSQRLFVGDEILRVDKAEAGLTRQRFPCVKLVPLLCIWDTCVHACAFKAAAHHGAHQALRHLAALQQVQSSAKA